MQLFYHYDLSEQNLTLPEDESKHIIRVLRKQKGDRIILIDGKGNEAVGIIETDNPKKCEVRVSSILHHVQNRPYYLHIAIAPTKQFERMDGFIEKAIEIGVDEITFIETQNSERDKVNLERCEKIAASAIKQSKQFWLPKIKGIKKLSEFLSAQNENPAHKLIAWCEEEQSNNFAKQLSKTVASRYVVLIGPEGDFTKQEIELAKISHFIPVSMGSNILRTETAGIFVCAAFACMGNK
ncbi:MAG: RsmE family RNA methyltransferase [Bacteroidota bacterium]|nr:RsmE family RNA methyltransferase [Bacteroidota bacterium]